MRPDKAASPVDVSPIDDGDQGYINALALSDVVLSEGNVVSTDVSDNAIVLAARQLKLKLHRFLTEQPAGTRKALYHVHACVILTLESRSGAQVRGKGR